MTTMPITETLAPAALDLTHVRAQFPSLSQTVNGHPAAFLDGPGGTQVPQRVIDAISDYLRRDNANTGGAYSTSRHTDAMLAEARAAMADFLHCAPDEIVFGPNMTTLTYMMSRAIGRDLGPGDEILVTRLDHDANVSPWLALQEKGVTIRWAEIHEEDCTSPPSSIQKPGSSPSAMPRTPSAPSIQSKKSFVSRTRTARSPTSTPSTTARTDSST
jgi:selenocysteine lyase/cysteine desulfurase